MKNKKPTGFLKWEKDFDFWHCESHNITISKLECDGPYYGVMFCNESDEFTIDEDTLREAKLAAEQHVIENLKIQLQKALKLKLI